MTDNDKYIIGVLSYVDQRLANGDEAEIIKEIVGDHKSIIELSQEDQWTLGAILGKMFHKAYCDNRRLPQPNENGMPNNPRNKVLKEDIDAPFVEAFKATVAVHPEAISSTLFIDENGDVVMDIANTDFTELSPYWQKDNFLAGCAATRSVMTSWDGLMHDNQLVRDFVAVAVANAIHESWIARGNVADWSKKLDTAYAQLPVDEKEKDLVHLKMAQNMLSKLYEMMQEVNKRKGADGESPSGPSGN